MGQIKRMQLTTLLVDQNKAQSSQNHLAFAFELAHVLDVDLELGSFTMENEMLVGDAIGVAISSAWWIQSHVLFV